MRIAQLEVKRADFFREQGWFKTWYHCVALAVLGLTEIYLPLLP